MSSIVSFPFMPLQAIDSRLSRSPTVPTIHVKLFIMDYVDARAYRDVKHFYFHHLFDASMHTIQHKGLTKSANYATMPNEVYIFLQSLEICFASDATTTVIQASDAKHTHGIAESSQTAKKIHSIFFSNRKHQQGRG